jgi:hypothetical protein
MERAVVAETVCMAQTCVKAFATSSGILFLPIVRDHRLATRGAIRATVERSGVALTRREFDLEPIPGKALALIGMRRVGKTYLCHQRIGELLASGVGNQPKPKKL